MRTEHPLLLTPITKCSFLCFSVTEGTGNDEVLSVPRQGRWVGVDAELRYNSAQYTFLQTTLYRQCQLRFKVRLD